MEDTSALGMDTHLTGGAEGLKKKKKNFAIVALILKDNVVASFTSLLESLCQSTMFH